jgi:hypothetical protein
VTTCPAGHDSGADDYCDVCGLPIEADAAAPSAAPAAPATPPTSPPTPEPAAEPEPETCPNCGSASPPNALFCEACGYDFTTGTAPRAASSLDLDGPGEGESLPPGSPVPPVPPVPPAQPEQPSEQVAPAEPPVEPPVAPALADAWVAEVWIDPDWYSDQDSADPLPSAGVPEVLPLRTTSVLVGRTSRSRNIHPDIDLSADNGISRRHCQLTTDGSRWWVEDLGSSNGTYVGASVGALPTAPLAPGDKREVAPDEHVYLGAWTRIVIRRATEGEI